MRWTTSYGIVDHQLLHGRYLHRLSHQALALYLFLVVVADRYGKSFYGDTTIETILRLTTVQLNQARDELVRHLLIDYRRPNWWVKSLLRQVKGGSSSGDRSVLSRPMGLGDLLSQVIRGMS